jgi:peptide/nickel transport system ATP-binding protein
MSLATIVGEPLRVHGATRRAAADARVSELFTLVGLDPSMRSRYAHELSGGERQRVGLARALALGPELLILDEPVSALDVSVQAQILALLERLCAELHLAYLFISHDLAVVERIADRVTVMYLGRVVESGPVADVLGRPGHPYTRGLIASTPGQPRSVGGTAVPRGEPPSALDPPSGCVFRSRCPHAVDACATTVPVLAPAVTGTHVACIRADELAEHAEAGEA